jgi:hypothetical protein
MWIGTLLIALFPHVTIEVRSQMFAALMSMTFIIPAVWLGYTLRAWWRARREWAAFSTDTKAFYLLVAPPMTLALDVVMLTDRLFYLPEVHTPTRIGST